MKHLRTTAWTSDLQQRTMPFAANLSSGQRSGLRTGAGSVEIPDYLFHLAVVAVKEGYYASASNRLREAGSHLASVASVAPDAARRAALSDVAERVKQVAAQRSLATLDLYDLETLFARAQLALADCQQRNALLAWLRDDLQRAGCYLDSAIRQMHRAQAWLNHAAPALERDANPNSDAQRIADALAEGWCVRSDRVSALLFGLEIEIAYLARSASPRARME